MTIRQALHSLAAATCLLACAEASGHPLLQNSLWLDVAGSEARVRVTVTLRELALVHGLKPGASGAIAAADIERAIQAHREYIAGRITITTEDAGTDSGIRVRPRVARLRSPDILMRDLPADSGEFDAHHHHPGPGASGPVVNPEQVKVSYDLVFPIGRPVSRILLGHDVLRDLTYGGGESWLVLYVVHLRRPESPDFETRVLRPGEPMAIDLHPQRKARLPRAAH